MDLINGEITAKQARDLLYVCYVEFCQIVGSGVCGCDACPYSDFNSDTEEGCCEAYIRDKLNEQLKRAEDNRKK